MLMQIFCDTPRFLQFGMSILNTYGSLFRKMLLKRGSSARRYGHLADLETARYSKSLRPVSTNPTGIGLPHTGPQGSQNRTSTCDSKRRMWNTKGQNIHSSSVPYISLIVFIHESMFCFNSKEFGGPFIDSN